MSKRRKNKPKTASRRKPATGQPAARAGAPQAAKAKKAEPTVRSSRAVPSSRREASTAPLVFGRDTYVWLAGAFGLILLGLLLMSGGGQPDPNEWDPNIIYNWRRITLAPLVMLAGVGVAIYAVFKK